MDIQGPKQGKVGQSLSFTTEVKSRYRLLVSGRIDYVFVYKNMTLKNELKRNIFIPLGIKTARKNQKYTATYCGDVMISYDKVYLYDVFGFCRVPISQTQKHHLVVYPGKVNIELLYNELSKPYENGVLQYQYKKRY